MTASKVEGCVIAELPEQKLDMTLEDWGFFQTLKARTKMALCSRRIRGKCPPECPVARAAEENLENFD